MYKYYIYAHLRTRVIRENKHVFIRKINRKIKKPVFKPVRVFVLPTPYNYTIFGFHAFYGAKNRLKRNVLIFYTVTHTRKSSILPFFCFLTRTHARIYASKQQNSNSTHYGNRSTTTKKIFSKIFSFAKFEIFVFGFSRNFLSSEMDYLHQTIASGFTRAPLSYILSVFIRSYTSACNLYFTIFATKYKKCIFSTIIFFVLTTKNTFALNLIYMENIFFSLLPTKQKTANLLK